MNVKSLRTAVAAAVGGAVLLAGLLIGASFALAQDNDDPEVTEESVDKDCLEHGFGVFADRARILGDDIDDLLADLGLSADEIKDQLAAGATLDEILLEAGIDVDAVIDTVRESVLSGIDDAVADGHLTEDQGEAIKERIEAFDLGEGGIFGGRGFGSFPNLESFDLRGFRFGGPGLGGFGDLDGFLDDMDLDLDALRQQLESGATLDEALENSGIDLEAMAEQAREEALAHLDEAVADGHMSQEQADSIKEMLDGVDFSGGLPFGLGGFRFDGEWPHFDMDGFGDHHGHGFGFFGGEEDA